MQMAYVKKWVLLSSIIVSFIMDQVSVDNVSLPITFPKIIRVVIVWNLFLPIRKSNVMWINSRIIVLHANQDTFLTRKVNVCSVKVEMVVYFVILLIILCASFVNLDIIIMKRENVSILLKLHLIIQHRQWILRKRIRNC